MSHKLSLLKDQTISNLGWIEFQNTPYDDGKINDITDAINNQEIPVTSIPSPFAQMHLFETSFLFVNKMATEDSSQLMGDTIYHKYVSHCLDIYELLFSYHLLGAENRISIKLWKIEELEDLKNDPNSGVQTFAETLQIFVNNYSNDARFKNNHITNPLDECYLIYLDNIIIAGTSPYTGFFTKGDRLPQTLKSTHNSRPFFSDNLPFHKRSEDFQRFMHTFFQNNAALTSCFKQVLAYIETSHKLFPYSHSNTEETYSILEIENKEISLLGSIPFECKTIVVKNEIDLAKNSDYAILSNKQLEHPPLLLNWSSFKSRWDYFKGPFPTESEDITLVSSTQIKGRVLPGKVLTYPWLTLDDILAPHLVQLNYSVNRRKFFLPESAPDNIILPIKKAYFDYFTINNLKKQLKVKVLNSGAILITLHIPVKGDDGKGIVKLERTYDYTSPNSIDSSKHGAIVESSLALGIYPFFKVNNPKYNDRYKILNYYNDNEHIDIDFLREQQINSTTLIHSNSHSRTRKQEGLAYITDYIELTTIKRDNEGNISFEKEKDISFDAISLTVENLETNQTTYGILIPLMGEPITLSNASDSAIAFDIGTSNSYVAIKKGNDIESLSTFTGTTNSAQPTFVMLNAPEESGDGKKDYTLSASNPVFGTVQFCEFMPGLIGNDAELQFPIRSIINLDNDTNSENIEDLNVLSSVNIPFNFGKTQMRKGYDITYSNIKWGVTDSSNDSPKNKLQVFIEQLAWMGRNELLKAGKNPEATKVLWFKPLSMGSNQMTVFNDIWEEIFNIYYNKNESVKNLISITESWAPFESYDKTFGSGQTFMNIDIGGGTSDIIIFNDGIPSLTTSFRFAGNSLFESMSGNNDFDNGFVTKYESLMLKHFKDDFTKANVIEYIKSSDGLTSTDLISFFFNHKTFAKKLALDIDFKLLFLLHNSAIFYHASQVLKMSNTDHLPTYIGVSGNGAKLLEITNGGNDLNRAFGISALMAEILKKVFDLSETPKLELQILKQPKESTAKGGIKGVTQFEKYKDADLKNYCISIGDDANYININHNNTSKNIKYSNYLEAEDTTITEVAKNVIGFFDYFFNELWGTMNLPRNMGVDKSYNIQELHNYFADQNKIENTIRQEVNKRKDTEPQLSETMFFYAIKALIYGFSKVIVSDKITAYKGS